MVASRWKRQQLSHWSFHIIGNIVLLWEVIFQRKSLTPWIVPNLIEEPSPTLNIIKQQKSPHPFLIYFQQTNPIRTLHSIWVPEHMLPYLESMTLLHKAVLSTAYLHNHFPNKDLLKRTRIPDCEHPNTPLLTGAQTIFHLTKWYLNSSPNPPHRKSLCKFSRYLATLTGIGNKD